MPSLCGHKLVVLVLCKPKSYLLVVGDYFSKWSEAIPIRDQEAITVANKLVDRVISILGVFMEIHSHQYSNFELQVEASGFLLGRFLDAQISQCQHQFSTSCL
jgi:hypothetical protein